MNNEDLVLRIKFNNNNKMIIKVTAEESTNSLMDRIKQIYALHYSKMIQLGIMTDENGFEIINDIRLSSLFKSGDVLCAYVREVGTFTNKSKLVGLINYDYSTNNNSYVKISEKENVIPDSIVKPEKNLKNEIKAQTNTENEDKNTAVVNNNSTNIEEEKDKKPRKRRTTKPKTEEKKVDNKKIKKSEVEDPFAVFQDLKKNEPVDTPSKILPPLVIKPTIQEDVKDIKELKKKSKVDYNAL